jgi:uncharacterized integral membrane protein (TIGR00698 family)
MTLSLIRGLLFALAISLLSIFLSTLDFMRSLSLSSLTIAIIIGLLYGNIFHKYTSRFTQDGIIFSQKKLLRLGIILFGFRITFQQICEVGFLGILFDVCVVASIVIIGYLLGTKLFKLSSPLSFLIASGSGVCGAAAVLAAEETSNAKPHEVSTAIATVVIYGTIAMFVFPYIVQLLGIGDKQMGIALGGTIHEVAQVVAGGNMINNDVTITAVIVKLARVMMLIPLLIIANYFFMRLNRSNKSSKGSIWSFFPWFALFFVLMSGINSLKLIPANIIDYINIFDNLLLTMAMTALGIETNINKVKSLGFKPFALAGILMLILTSYLFITPML